MLRRNITVITFVCLFTSWASPLPALVISEFMADNETVLVDEDGDNEDWFELLNDEATTVNLDGYHATDDPLLPMKWTFPSIQLAPGETMVVFASNKDRPRTSGQNHTNFRLSQLAGSYLAITAPDGAVVFAYEDYPQQVEDFSYGLEQNSARFRLVRSEVPARALVPTSNIGTTWRNRGFNDGSWESGDTGVGYDENIEYRGLIGLDVDAEMNGENTTCFIRVPFDGDDAAGATQLVLRMKYDDGFVAWVNGREIARANFSGSPTWDSESSGQHDDGAAVEFVTYDVNVPSDLIVSGSNVLAIQGLNDNLGSSDFLAMPELDALTTGDLDPNTRLFFPEPTPGTGNLQGFPGVSPTPSIDADSAVFSGSIDVPVSLPVGAPANTVLRYELDGSVPDESSPQVTGGTIPLSVSGLVALRSFVPSLSPSPVVTAGFLRVSTIGSFSSNLPIVLIENFGAGAPGGSTYQTTITAIFEPDADGTTRLTSTPTLTARAGIKTRGSSTAGQPKKQYAFEFRDASGDGLGVNPLGMPRESDWVLYGGNGFDHTTVRNKFIFDLSLSIGTYASRSRMCEIWFNTGGGSISTADYIGVYAFTEKIKRDDDRVDVERLTADDIAEPEVTGGYMFKIDRLDPGDSGFRGAGRTLGWVYPKEDLVAPQQSSWLSGYMDQFNSALNGANFRDPVRGYRAFIDADLWIDHHILNVLAMNVDALRLSTYFYKARNGPVVAGPVWDFDRSMGLFRRAGRQSARLERNR